MEPTNVHVIVRTDAGETLTRDLERPTLGDLTDALNDLFSRVDCDAKVCDVKVSYDYPDGRALTPADDLDASPESIAAYLWDEMVNLRY